MSYMLGVLFPEDRELDPHFWREMVEHLQVRGFGLSFMAESEACSERSDWRNVARGEYPDPKDRCHDFCDKPNSREARLLVQWSEADPTNAPYVLPLGARARELVDARQRYMSLQFRFVADESIGFGVAFAEAAAQVLDGLVDDQSAGLLRTPDGEEFLLPDEDDEPSEEESEEDDAGDAENAPVDLNGLMHARPPLAAPMTFVLECRASFTPQAVLELMQRAAPEAKLVGGGDPEGKRTHASEKWVSFQGWHRETGLLLRFERVAGRNPFYVRVACELLEEYVEPTEAHRRAAALLAVKLMQTVTSSLPLIVIDVER